MITVKVCGITSLSDAEGVVDAGADAVGFIFYEGAPRFIPPASVKEIASKLPSRIIKVGVFVNFPSQKVVEILQECHLDIAQLHGSETAETANAIGVERVWKAVSLKSERDIERAYDFPCAALLTDSMTAESRGGTGQVGNWELAAELARKRPVILAGGLSPDNVAAAVNSVDPFGIDLNSGVEIAPGRKDVTRVRAAVAALRSLK